MDVKKKEKKITMTAKKITVINEKGGVGKSSIAFNCAYELSREARVLMIDLDAQRANLSWMAGVMDQKDENGKVTTAKDSYLTMFDVMTGANTIHECIVQIKDNLDLIPANSKVLSFSRVSSERKFKNALKEVENEYDYIFIDVDPTPSLTHKVALMVTDYVIIPMLPDFLSLEADVGVIDDIFDTKDFNKDLKVLGIVFNKCNDRLKLTKTCVTQAEELANNLKTSVFNTRIRNAVSLSECPFWHTGVTEYDPDSGISQDIRDLVAEIKEKTK